MTFYFIHDHPFCYIKSLNNFNNRMIFKIQIALQPYCGMITISAENYYYS